MSQPLLAGSRPLQVAWALLPLSFEFYAVAARQRTVCQFLERYFKDHCEVLAALVQHGSDRGEFQPVQAERVAITIAALYEGLAQLWIVGISGSFPVKSASIEQACEAPLAENASCCASHGLSDPFGGGRLLCGTMEE